MGLTISTATILAERVGLVLEEEHRQTDEAPPGNIIEQSPEVGERVQPGSVVHVLVAQEANTISVPDVRGATEEDALAVLVEAGLLPGGRFMRYDATVPEGLVVRTDPQTGTEVALGDHGRLLPLARSTPGADHHRRAIPGPRRQLSLRGPRACRQQIEDAGLVLGDVEPGPPESDGSWLVEDQDPAAGAEVQPGTTVESDGDRPRRVLHLTEHPGGSGHR